MSLKKSRVGKMLKNIQQNILQMEDRGAEKTQMLSSLNVSSIEKASFFEEDNISNHGNPLHSTALEDEFSPTLQKRVDPPPPPVRREETKGRKSGVKKNCTPARQQGRAVKLRSLCRVSEGMEVVATTSSGSEVATTSSGSEDQTSPSSISGTDPAARKGMRSRLKTPTLTGRKRSLPAPSTHPSPLERGSTTNYDKKRLTSLSSEDLSDEDVSWKTNQGRKKLSSTSSATNGTKDMGKKKKSQTRSSGSTEVSGKKKHKRQNVRNPIDLDIVLEAFQDFVSEYLETIDSKSVKQAINALHRTFENRLMGLISETKELSTLKKQNAKIDSAINRKRTRLVEVKNEQIKNEVKLRKMEKEHAQLQQRMADVQKSTAFLADLRELNREYLEHQEQHPDEVEVYGPSSLPVLLLEARHVLEAGQQLKIINEKLQQALDQAPSS